MPEPQVTKSFGCLFHEGKSQPVECWRIHLDDELIWQTPDEREAAMFYAELKGRLKLADREAACTGD